jgi:hypothetical protein
VGIEKQLPPPLQGGGLRGRYHLGSTERKISLLLLIGKRFFQKKFILTILRLLFYRIGRIQLYIITRHIQLRVSNYELRIIKPDFFPNGEMATKIRLFHYQGSSPYLLRGGRGWLSKTKPDFFPTKIGK